MQGLFSIGSFVPKLPPSELGFVCKPELPPHINILFRARPPLQYIEMPHKEIHRHYTGLFDLANNENILSRFEKKRPDNLEIKYPKRILRLVEIIKKTEKQKEANRERFKEWDPKSNTDATTNPYKTLFVYKLDKSIEEDILKKEFEKFGQIKQVKIIRAYNGVSRGYGFIEYEHSKDFKEAINRGKGKKVNGFHVLVDKERGRTDKRFKPRKYGGGKGKGRDFPIWLEEELYQIKKKYPELIKNNINEINNNNQIINNIGNNSKDLIDTKKKSMNEIELELGEIEDDNSENINKQKIDDDELLRHKRSRNLNKNKYSKNRSKSSQSKHYNSDYSDGTYESHSSNRKFFNNHSNRHSFYVNKSSLSKKKVNKKENKEGSEEGEIN